MSKIITVLPSLPAQNFIEYEALFAALRGVADSFQIDFVDGEFVEAAPSWPFNTPEGFSRENLLQLSAHTKYFELSADCMVENPAQYFSLLKEVGFTRVVIHAHSTTDILADIKKAKSLNFIVGLAILNTTEKKYYEELLEVVDYVQVMGIAKIGQQGQPFDGSTLHTIQSIKTQFPTIEVAVDGSVNKHTIKALVAAGATRLAPGSAIAKADDPLKAYCELLLLAQS